MTLSLRQSLNVEARLLKLKEEKEAILNPLLDILKPGDTVYCVLRHVSRSGMRREISLFTKEMRCIDGLAARALGYRIGKRGGLVVTGCGMDMGFHLVYNLGWRLFPQGFVPADAGRTYGRNGQDATVRDTDGGYALNSAWI
jgi:hypothetical protein